MQRIKRLENMPNGFEPVELVDCLKRGSDLAETAKARAQAILTILRQRNSVFGSGRMTDPYWEILIKAFAAHQPVSRDEFCQELALPEAVVARWIAIAERDGLIKAQSELILASYVMTDKGQSLMEQALA